MVYWVTLVTTLEGTVRDKDGHVVEGAMVRYQNDRVETMATTYTDQMGRYYLEIPLGIAEISPSSEQLAFLGGSAGDYGEPGDTDMVWVSTMHTKADLEETFGTHSDSWWLSLGNNWINNLLQIARYYELQPTEVNNITYIDGYVNVLYNYASTYYNIDYILKIIPTAHYTVNFLGHYGSGVSWNPAKPQIGQEYLLGFQIEYLNYTQTPIRDVGFTQCSPNIYRKTAQGGAKILKTTKVSKVVITKGTDTVGGYIKDAHTR
jgi:hypothetical protein